MSQVSVRVAQAADGESIEAVHRAAFETDLEARLVQQLADGSEGTVSLLAETEGSCVGHILFTPASVDGHAGLAVAGLAPMAVLPSFQRRGIGGALVEAGLRVCRAAGYGAVVVLGHPSYYPRFGFVAASRFGLKSTYDVPDEVFMAIELESQALDGVVGFVRYHPAFDEL